MSSEYEARVRMAQASVRARFPERFNDDGSLRSAPAIQSQGRVIRKPRRADQDEPLAADVADTIGDYTPEQLADRQTRQVVAHEIIVMVRERVLREIESYARENVR